MSHSKLGNTMYCPTRLKPRFFKMLFIQNFQMLTHFGLGFFQKFLKFNFLGRILGQVEELQDQKCRNQRYSNYRYK